MEMKDLLLTPLYLGLIYALAFAVQGQVTNIYTRKYFIPALTVKLIGAIALGLIYEFYYKGGDTFNYFHHIKIIQEAFGDSFSAGVKMLTAHGEYIPETIKYSSRMFWYRSAEAEYDLVRLGAVLAFFSFTTYTVIALFFAVISFSGMWAMYLTFLRIRPQLYKQLAYAVFFVPSLFFWGSGLMKDSICVGALGWLFYAFYKGVILRRQVSSMLLVGGLAAYVLFSIKVYILLSFLPPALLWVFNENSQRIRNAALRTIARPILIGTGLLVAVFAATTLTEGDAKYDVDNIGERSKITADYLYGISQEGSAYSLGEQDGTISGMLKLAPQAIVVSLFRPFLWEVKNPIMLLSALESLFFLGFTGRILFRLGPQKTIGLIVRTPVLVLCFVFSLVFAATVGIVSYNFGTLVRYKIPLIPFYVAGLLITQSIGEDSVRQPTRKTKGSRLARA